MKDYFCVGYAPLADFSTSPWGVLKVVDGVVTLDRVKAFNRARRMLHAGARFKRILRRGVWECLVQFDFEDPGYFPLLAELAAIMHQPFQGDNPPPGAKVQIDAFDGCSEYWQYDPANFERARTLLRGLFATFKDVDYVVINPGNEMNHEGYKRLLNEVIIPEYVAAGKIPFSFGPCYSIHEDLFEETKKFHGIQWGDRKENRTYRNVHGVKDETSQTLIDTVAFWTPDNNDISIMWSVDGVWDGESLCDYEGKHRRPSPEQVKRAMRYWMDRVRSFVLADGHRKFGFEYLPKARNNDDCAAKAVAAISEMHFERFGVWPENYGKYPDDWKDPTPPAPPTPPTPPEPVKPEPWYAWNRIRNVRRWTWQAWLAIVVFGLILFKLMRVV